MSATLRPPRPSWPRMSEGPPPDDANPLAAAKAGPPTETLRHLGKPLGSLGLSRGVIESVQGEQPRCLLTLALFGVVFNNCTAQNG